MRIPNLFFILVVSFLCITQTYAIKRAIVIGASSGMGKEIAKLLNKQGYELGLCARRIELLKQLNRELSVPCHIEQIDVTQVTARKQLEELISRMGGLDLIVISISPYLDNRKDKGPSLHLEESNDWQEKERTIDVCAKGFIAMADIALEYFKKQNHGHFVGISSTSGLHGSASCPEYSAAKACVSMYMQAQRNYMIQNNYNITITDVVAGYVAVEHSPFGQDPSAYWEITTQEAGKAILAGIDAKKDIIYVPERVRIISMLLRFLPSWAYNRYFYWL